MNAAANRRRAQKTERTVLTHAGVGPKRDYYNHEVEEGIRDLLSDLRHLCDLNKLSFNDLNAVAHRNYLAEIQKVSSPQSTQRTQRKAGTA